MYRRILFWCRSQRFLIYLGEKESYFMPVLLVKHASISDDKCLKRGGVTTGFTKQISSAQAESTGDVCCLTVIIILLRVASAEGSTLTIEVGAQLPGHTSESY